jgi:transketolase N-terminal domain/subunit
MDSVDSMYAVSEQDFSRYEVVKDVIDECIDISLNYRQSGHPGGSRSKTHILVSLMLSGAMRWDIRRPWLTYADRFVLSAGHAVPLVYSALAVLNEAMRQQYARTGEGFRVTPRWVGDHYSSSSTRARQGTGSVLRSVRRWH